MAQLEIQIGVTSLINKCVKLEESINSLGVMIKGLREKRAILEKQIEDTSVDLKNLRGKVSSVTQYIEEEKKGLTVLSQRRATIEMEADDLGGLVNTLRENISLIDETMNAEHEHIKQITPQG